MAHSEKGGSHSLGSYDSCNDASSTSGRFDSTKHQNKWKTSNTIPKTWSKQELVYPPQTLEEKTHLSSRRSTTSEHENAGLRVQNSFAVPQSVLSLLNEAKTLRECVIRERVKLNIWRRDHKSQRKHTRAAQKSFTICSKTLASRVSNSNLPNGPFSDAVEQAWEKLDKSTKRLDVQEQHLKDIEQSLNALEARLEDRETLLYHRLQTLNQTNGLQTNEPLSNKEVAPSTSDSSSATPLVVQEYYSRTGDLKNLRERLRWFENEHAREVAQRQEKKELDEPLNPPEKLFYETYVERRRALVQDLYAAKRDSDCLKGRCYEDGHSLEESTQGSQRQDHLDRSHRVNDSLLRFHSLPENSYNGFSSLDMLLELGYADTGIRISRWITDVQRKTVTPREMKSITEQVTEPNLQSSEAEPGDASNYHSADVKINSDLQFPDYGLLNPPYRQHFGGSPIHCTSNHRNAPTVFQGEAPRKRYSDPSLKTHNWSSIDQHSIHKKSVSET